MKSTRTFWKSNLQEISMYAKTCLDVAYTRLYICNHYFRVKNDQRYKDSYLKTSNRPIKPGLTYHFYRKYMHQVRTIAVVSLQLLLFVIWTFYFDYSLWRMSRVYQFCDYISPHWSWCTLIAFKNQNNCGKIFICRSMLAAILHAKNWKFHVAIFLHLEDLDMHFFSPKPSFLTMTKL